MEITQFFDILIVFAAMTFPATSGHPIPQSDEMNTAIGRMCDNYNKQEGHLWNLKAFSMDLSTHTSKGLLHEVCNHLKNLRDNVGENQRGAPTY